MNAAKPDEVSIAAATPSRVGNRNSLSRRGFLQVSSAVAVTALLPAWLAEQAEAATPIGSGDGVLVLLTMGGGNDGLNTFVPISSGAYYDARGGLAFAPNETLAMTSDRGLNKNLPYLKSQWDQGRLAVVDGVGMPDTGLSHFVTMAQLMAGRSDSRIDGTGWLGRYTDGFPSDPFRAISISSSVPPVVIGKKNRATAISQRRNSFLDFVADTGDQTHVQTAMNAMGSGSVGRGSYGDRIGDLNGQAIDLAKQVGPIVQEDQPNEAEVVTKMRLAARLINANLGIRVLSIVFGDFDTHSDQEYMHGERMQEIDAAMRTFNTTLSSTFASRTLVVGTSEFGRRVAFNGTGTDHGTANSMFVLGSGVVGGIHGALPSLSNLDRDGNMKPAIDFRQFYGNLTSQWLGGDSAEVIGRDYEDLGFLGSPGTNLTQQPVIPIVGTPTPKPAEEPTEEPETAEAAEAAETATTPRAQIARLYLAFFRRLPDAAGHAHWVAVMESGRSLASIADEFSTSAEFKNQYGRLSNGQFVDLVYRNVLGRSPDSEGRNYWSGLLSKGDSRGSVMTGFSESSEFARSTAATVAAIETTGPIGRLYWAYFLRKPDPEGLAYWTRAGLTPAVVSDQFATSQEFVGRYGSLSDAEFVQLVYRNVLGRKPDSAGFDHWKKQLRSGKSRGTIMLGFSDSPEFVAIVRRRS